MTEDHLNNLEIQVPPHNDIENSAKNYHFKEKALTETTDECVPCCPDESESIYDVPSSASQVSKGVLRKLFIASAIAFIFLLIEAVGGILSGSLAILSDAAHMFSDISGFFISIMSIWVGTRPASKRLSFGYHRAEIIGALVSIVLIWGLTIALLYEATTRIVEQQMVKDPLFMLSIAIFGLFSNIAMAKVLHSSPGHSHSCSSHDHGEQNHNHEVHKHDHADHKHNHGDHKHNHGDHKHDHADQKHCKSHSHGADSHHHSDKLEQDQQPHSHKHDHDGKKPCKGETQEEHSHQGKKNHNHSHDKEISHSCATEQAGLKNSSSPKSEKIAEKDNYNLRAAMIHVIGDVIQSIGVVVAALLIYLLGDSEQFDYWHLADPICTYLFSILVMFTTFQIVKDCIRVLMEGSPSDIEVQEFKEKLQRIESVVEVHDLHIWSLSVGKPSMSVHIVVNGDMNSVLKNSTDICRQNGIYHSTIQIEDLALQNKPGYIKCKHNIHY